MKRVLSALVVGLALVLAGCSSSGTDELTHEDAFHGPHAEAVEDSLGEPLLVNESAILRLLGVNEDGYVYADDGTECEPYVILTSPNAISLYRDAGDPVVTDPAGLVGVKVTGPETATCAALYEERLAAFDPTNPNA